MFPRAPMCAAVNKVAQRIYEIFPNKFRDADKSPGKTIGFDRLILFEIGAFNCQSNSAAMQVSLNTQY